MTNLDLQRQTLFLILSINLRNLVMGHKCCRLSSRKDYQLPPSWVSVLYSWHGLRSIFTACTFVEIRCYEKLIRFRGILEWIEHLLHNLLVSLKIFNTLLDTFYKQELRECIPPSIWKVLGPLNRKLVGEFGSLMIFLYPEYQLNEAENRKGSKLHRFPYCWIISE